MDQNQIDNADETTPENLNQPKKPKSTAFYKKRSFRYGSVATAFTAIFIVIVVLVNIGLTVLAGRYPISLDLTNAHQYDLSAATISYLAKIKQPITIKFFATKGEMEGATNYLIPMKIIEQYPKYNSNIKIQYIDYDKDPTAVAQYSNASIVQGDVVVTTTGKDNKEVYKYISSSDLLLTSTDQTTGDTTVVGNQAEQEIDTALDFITSTNHPTILFTSGHGEQDSSTYQALLKTGNYDVEDVDTATSAINESASAIEIVAPKNDFTPAEINKIDIFLKNGGKFGKSAFIYFDPGLTNLKNLDEYTTEWGIQVNSGIIYDETNSLETNPLEPIASTVDQTTVGADVPTTTATDVKDTSPLTLLFDTKDVRTTLAVMQTGDTSALAKNINNIAPSSTDQKGPFTVMALSTWSQQESTGTLAKSNLLVSGSYDIMEQDLLQASNINNARDLLGITDTLTAKTSSINIPSKTYDTHTLTLTTSQDYAIAIIFLIFLPLAILALGFFQYFRRRHL